MSPRLAGFLMAATALAVTGHPAAAQNSNMARARQLASVVDSLEAAGEWRNAIAPLDRLLELVPTDPARLRQRGLFAAWSGDRKRGVVLLRRAVAQRHNNDHGLRLPPGDQVVENHVRAPYCRPGTRIVAETVQQVQDRV